MVFYIPSAERGRSMKIEEEEHSSAENIRTIVAFLSLEKVVADAKESIRRSGGIDAFSAIAVGAAESGDTGNALFSFTNIHMAANENSLLRQLIQTELERSSFLEAVRFFQTHREEDYTKDELAVVRQMVMQFVSGWKEIRLVIGDPLVEKQGFLEDIGALESADQEIRGVLAATASDERKLVETQWKAVETYFHAILKSKICTNVFLTLLLKVRAKLDASLRHDLNNLATSVIGFASMLEYDFPPQPREKKGIDDNMETLHLFLSQLPVYLGIIKDNMLRVQENSGREHEVEEQQVFYPSTLESLFLVISNTSIISSDIKNMLRIQNGNINFQNDEVIQGDFAVFSNAVINCIRNAGRESVRARTIRLSVEREQDEVVVRVEDAGIGMPASFLDPSSTSFIMNEGVSGSGSTGHGLGGLDARSLRGGITLFVYSKQQDNNQPVVYVNDPQRQQEAAALLTSERSVPIWEEGQETTAPVSTLFDFRLPIVHKSASATLH